MRRDNQGNQCRRNALMKMMMMMMMPLKSNINLTKDELRYHLNSIVSQTLQFGYRQRLPVASAYSFGYTEETGHFINVHKANENLMHVHGVRRQFYLR